MWSASDDLKVRHDAPSVSVPIASLLPGDSPRVCGEDPEHIQLLAEAHNVPPILVHRSTMRVIDGMHRLRAAMMRGDETISTRFFEGDDREAFLLSVEANINHGLPLSRADREAAARRILVLYWQWSDRAVAAVTGLSPTTVSAIRQRLDLPAELEGRRVGRDGRVRPRDGSAGRRRAGAVIASRPDAPLRAIAEEAGVSVGTARDVRARLQAGQDPVLATSRDSAEERAAANGGGRESPRRRTAGTATTVDWSAVRANLSKDPSVKYAESGRALVRWLDAHVIEQAGLSDLAGAVPAHWRGSVAELARSCAEGWLALAQDLEDGT
jgi:ParB-like chromosome segregation protein Spo0J